MYVAFFHPTRGAVAIDVSNIHCVDTRFLQYQCPRCNKSYGPALRQGPILSDYCPQCNEAMQKHVDNVSSLSDNKPMCKSVRFVTAVALAMNELMTSKFSAHDVTKKLRYRVGTGDWEISDKSLEDVDGVSTYRIDHEEVKNVVNELFDVRPQLGCLSGLVRESNGKYFEYSLGIPDTGSYTGTPTTPVTTVTPPPIPTVSMTPVPFSPVTPSTADLEERDLLEKLRTYLRGRVGDMVTMKEIQSRFKGVPKTCRDFAHLVGELGLPVNSRAGAGHSTWTCKP